MKSKWPDEVENLGGRGPERPGLMLAFTALDLAECTAFLALTGTEYPAAKQGQTMFTMVPSAAEAFIFVNRAQQAGMSIDNKAMLAERIRAANAERLQALNRSAG